MAVLRRIAGRGSGGRAGSANRPVAAPPSERARRRTGPPPPPRAVHTGAADAGWRTAPDKVAARRWLATLLRGLAALLRGLAAVRRRLVGGALRADRAAAIDP